MLSANNLYAQYSNGESLKIIGFVQTSTELFMPIFLLPNGIGAKKNSPLMEKYGELVSVFELTPKDIFITVIN